MVINERKKVIIKSKVNKEKMRRMKSIKYLRVIIDDKLEFKKVLSISVKITKK